MKILKSIFKIVVALCILVLLLIILKNFNRKSGGEIVVKTNLDTVIEKLHAVNKLETAELTVTKIMEAEKELQDYIPETDLDDIFQKLLFQDKMIFELQGKVVAGIDLNKISTGDITMNRDGTVSIKIPDAEILHIIIDENSKIFDRQVGYLTKGDTDMETKIRNQAKKDMREEAIEKGILEKARQNAHSALAGLLKEMNIQLSDGVLNSMTNDENIESNQNSNSYEI